MGGAGEDIQVAAAVLSKRYEEQLFSQASNHSKVVPALVITGFLGSGKTTTVQHLLATTGQELKLGVLVNEVASLDVDGQLLSTAQSNASAGIKAAAHLAGGCACCSVSSNLQEALHELAGSSNYQQLDYLLLETSGVADVEPLAALLTSSGFKLAGVVTVVDAEAGSSQLEHEGVALAQLRAADVVVINKCDLCSLSMLASLEDLIQDKAPGVRMLRARFGQVPPEALLDIDVEAGVEDMPPFGGAPDSQQQQQGGVQGEIAFLSHEPVVSTGKLKGGKGFAGRSLVSSQRAAKLGAAAAGAGAGAADGSAGGVDTQGTAHPSMQQQQQQQQHDGNGHRDHSHSSFVSVSFSSTQPLCMACFQACVTSSMLPATGLYRAKGFVWFQQQRSLQYVFHISGKQRAECGATGKWQGPPGVQVVLIGQEQQLLEQLKQQLQACEAACCACASNSGQAACQQGVDGAQQLLPGGEQQSAPQQQPGQTQIQREPQQQQQQQDHVSVDSLTPRQPNPTEKDGLAGCNAAAAAFARLIQQHHRFELWPPQQQPTQSLPSQQQQHPGVAGPPEHTSIAAAAVVAQGASHSLVQFTAMGSPLHGVVADEVNAAVLRKANATPGLLFLCHVKSPPALRIAAANQQQQVAFQGVVALQLCFKSSDTAEFAEQQWQQLEAALAPVLRKAYQHVHNCKCDVVQLMSA